MVDHVLILAGGSGTRLWPASNSKMPKQFLPVQDGKSLLQLTIERALALGIKGNVIIITLKEQLDPIIAECGKIGKGRDKLKVIPEPAARNTAPAIAIAAEYLKGQSGGQGAETVVVLTADHLITPIEKFTENVRAADELARQDKLVTFGIPPTRPETGYGYIETAEKLPPGLKVASFREKPDEATAKRFVDKGNYFWNSGMFAFKVERYLDELTNLTPEIGSLFSGIGSKGESRRAGGIEVVMEGAEVEKVYQASPKDSIDYAVMEKSTSSAMVKASFDWNDIGSWEEMAALYAAKEAEGEQAGAAEAGNTNGGDEELIAIESADNFVYSDRPVALCGVEDLMVVVKNGAVLIAKKGAGQQVKQVVNELKERGRQDLL
jgi:mannose-1-phosphate guanylyltransferase/mannose-6-phosphate isomerase